MKLKIFSVALMVFTGLMAHSTLNYAQRTNQADTSYTKKLQKIQEQMRSLQKEMSELRADEAKKGYSDEARRENADRQAKRQVERAQISADNAKRMSERIAENSRRMAEQMVANTKRMSERFDNSFKNFGNNFRFNFNSNDSSLEKKVRSGEIKEKTKNFSKSYAVNGNDKLQIDNRYGKVTVNTWDKNEFKVEVQMKAYANDDADAQKLLDKTSIADSKESDLIGFKTVIDNEDNKDNNFWGFWTNNGKTTVREMIINYTVYIPAKNALNVTNRYGGVELPNILEGKVTINNSYGSLIAKSLTNSEDKINVRYGNAKIANFAGSNLDVAYGSLSLDDADKLNATVQYGSAKIGKISTSGNVNVRFGGLEIADLDKNLKTLSVSSSYSPVKVNTPTGTNADFEVTVRYGDFLYDNSVSVTAKNPEDGRRGSTSKNYKGHVGKGSPDKVITVTANYGSVKFN
jgi:hypothetical protein